MHQNKMITKKPGLTMKLIKEGLLCTHSSPKLSM